MIRMVFLVIKKKKSVQNVQRGRTSLHLAARKGRHMLAGILLKRGGNLEATDRDGYTPLHMAAEKGHIDVVAFLLGKGANKDALAKVR